MFDAKELLADVRRMVTERKQVEQKRSVTRSPASD